MRISDWSSDVCSSDLWLEAKGIAYDVMTDEDIDEGGAEALEPYATVLTGSHPEYHTTGTLDALEGYTGSGGRLVYLGGNGFYWRSGLSPRLPGVIEGRRAATGIRAWASSEARRVGEACVSTGRF